MAELKPPSFNRVSAKDNADIVYQAEGLKIDEELGIVYDVWVCGLEGRNEAKRVYPLKVLDAAKGLYENALINLDHTDDDDSYRSFSDRFGWLTGLYCKDNGLWAKKLHCNVRHKEYPSLVWWAKNNPKAIGLSHDVLYTKSLLPDGRTKVDEILKVNCVDLVANPSTTYGLKEGLKKVDENKLMAETAKENDEVAPGGEGYASYIGALVSAIMVDAALSIEDKKKKLLVALKLMEEEAAPAVEAEDSEVGADLEEKEVVSKEAEEEEVKEGEEEEKKDEGKESMKQLKAKLDRYETKEKIENAKEGIKALCKREKLPQIAITDTFINSLIDMSEKEQIELINDRKALTGSKSKAPVSVARESVEAKKEVKPMPPVDDLMKLAQSYR